MLRATLAALLLTSSLACASSPAPARPDLAAEPVAAAPYAGPAVEIALPGPRAEVGRMSYVAQTWNNCGPASVVMVLSHLGVDASQEVARLALRGPDISRGMPAQNVAPWVGEQYGLKAIVRTNGSRDTVRTLVANGFPVIVTQWLQDAPSRI